MEECQGRKSNCSILQTFGRVPKSPLGPPYGYEGGGGKGGERSSLADDKSSRGSSETEEARFFLRRYLKH